MKKEWKVYIKGVPNRGNEVIKALTDLGAKEGFYSKSGSNENFIYFINHKGEIDEEYLDTESGQIIMDNYREIKLPLQCKNGEILINNAETCYKIFSDYDTDNDGVFYAQPWSISTDGKITEHQYGALACYQKDYRIATSYEVMCFYKLLHDCNKDWDPEKKQVVDLKWKPEMTHKFYFVDINGKVKIGIHDKETDNVMFDFGNCFHTKEEAENAAKKIQKLLKKE